MKTSFKLIYMDKHALKRMVENSILDNNLDERFCQLYESVINELDDKKYIINFAQKLSPVKTPILTITLKKRPNRPTIFIFINKHYINLKFVCRVFEDVPLNKINKLIDDCYYNRNESKIADEYNYSE